MSIVTQFYLLQYKSWKLRYRKKLVTLFEFFIPVLLCLLMVIIRSTVVVTEYPEPTYFPSFHIGLLPQNLIAYTNPVTFTVILAYTPKTPVTDELMRRVADSLHPSPLSPRFVSGKYAIFKFSFCIKCDYSSRELCEFRIFESRKIVTQYATCPW